jgi:hypothetical protein
MKHTLGLQLLMWVLNQGVMVNQVPGMKLMHCVQNS